MIQSTLIEKPERLLFRAFAGAILIGTFLLMTPWAAQSGGWTDPLTALFTATSATCVTGLSVVDTGSYFSGFGQAVILLLIQFGGLGIMTIGTFLLILVGRRLTAAEEFAVADYAVGALRIRGLKSLLVWTVGLTFIFETVGALILAGRLAARGMDAGGALYHGFFHSVSAFCNAGFSLYADSLAGFARDPVWLLTTAVLIFAGGLGFLVLYDICTLRFRRPAIGLRRRLTLHSRIVLTAAALLVAAGAVGFALLEWGNTLAPLPDGEKGWVAFFHAVTPRTAGFNVVDLRAVQPATRFMTVVLMFIGGAPCSAAGGIKVTSVVVLLMVIRSLLRGRRETEIHGRTIPTRAVREALTIFLLALLLIGAVFGLLLIMERPLLSAAMGFTSEDLMFETVSAFATVGLSTGITPHLSEFGRLCIVFLMFVGRLGPLAMALMIGKTKVRQVIRYPEEDILVG
jgi:trk system potassium uptake protein